jgi:uncharacterized membrane protein YphA (DoxX/SURF4 family)
MGLFLLRFTGLYLAFGHGHMKIASLMHGEADQFIGMLKSMGFPSPGLFAWLAASAEFVGGLFVFVGFLTRVAAAFAAIDLFTAAVVVHHAHLQALHAVGLNSTQPKPSRCGATGAGHRVASPCWRLVFCGPGRISRRHAPPHGWD